MARQGGRSSARLWARGHTCTLAHGLGRKSADHEQHFSGKWGSGRGEHIGHAECCAGLSDRRVGNGAVTRHSELTLRRNAASLFRPAKPGRAAHASPAMPEGQSRRIALGSGFIIDPSGYVVTNSHVVGDASKVEVTLQDDSKYPAKIIGRDPKTDIALLKIKADKPLPHVTFGDSSAAQVGDWVMAVGNPFGLGGTVTTGIISARGRDIHSGPFDDFLQIDAPINRGNSGGPTFNLDGQVIGINTAIYSPNGGSVGIGFAVPSNVAKTVVAQLEQHGKVSRGWLGVQIQEVTPAIAASLGLQGEHGALVAVVTPNSPGAKAGLKQGDVILSFNGSEVGRLRDLSRLVAETTPDSSAKLKVWRNGQTVELQTTVGELATTDQVASAAGEQEEERATP